MKARVPATQWTSMYTADGKLTIGVVVGGRYGEVCFTGDALLNLRGHVDAAIGQRLPAPRVRARRSR